MKIRGVIVGLLLALLTLAGCHGKKPTPDAPPPEHCRYSDGIDILGKNSRAWNCPAFIAALKTVPCQIPLGYFGDGTFGPNTDSCIQEAINTGKVWALRAHFAWTAHKPASAAQLTPAAQQFNALCAANPAIECYPSAICEHSMTAGQSAALHGALRPLLTAPNMKQWVDSGMNAKDPGAIPECHGNRKACPVVSQDGGDNGNGNGMLDVNVEAVKELGSLFTLLWDTSLNCKFSTKDTRAPQQRTDCPTAEEFAHFFALLSPMPPFPSIPGVVRPANGQIYKPSSDNHGGCKGKDCKALWMTNPFPGGNPNTIPFTATDGRPLGVFTCYKGNTNCNDRRNWFEGRLVRYYAATGAYPISQQSEFIVINEGRAKILVNALRRDGVLR